MKILSAIPFEVPAALLLLFLFAWPIDAQELPAIELDQPIRPGAERTFRDLIKLALPDLSEDGKVGHTNYVRDGWLVNEASLYEGKMELAQFRGAWMNTPRGQRLVLFLQLEGESNPTMTWGQLSLLAIYDPSAQPKLLDLVDVGGDRVTTFWGTLELGPKSAAVVIAYEHLNAGENYRHYVFLQANDDQLGSLFDGFPFLYYGRTLGREIAEDGEFFSRRGADPRHRDLAFNVSSVVTRYSANDETVRGKRTTHFRMRAVWRRGRYRFADAGAELKRMLRLRKRAGFG